MSEYDRHNRGKERRADMVAQLQQGVDLPEALAEMKLVHNSKLPLEFEEDDESTSDMDEGEQMDVDDVEPSTQVKQEKDEEDEKDVS